MFGCKMFVNQAVCHFFAEVGAPMPVTGIMDTATKVEVSIFVGDIAGISL